MTRYTPKEINAMSPQEMRKAYSELRSVANKRIARMSAQGLGRKGRKKQKPFKTLKGMSSREVETALKAVSQWLREPTHTVKGYKRQRAFVLEQMRERYGYDFITTENYEDFVDFMEDMRERNSGKTFDSGDAADVFNEAMRIKISPYKLKKEFDYFADHMKELEQMEPLKSGKGRTMESIKNEITRLGNIK